MSHNGLLKEYTAYRCSLYFWLKNVYISEPTPDVIRSMVEDCKAYVLEEDIPEYEEKWVTYFSHLKEEEIETLCQAARIEYARLFIGPRQVVAPPYESVYRTATRSMFGAHTKLIRELYENAGLKLDVKDNIPEDFVGFELEFMYYLCHETLKALEEAHMEKVEKLLVFQKYFVEAHLSQWIEKFTQDIEEGTKLELFKVIASFTRGFIMSDYISLGQLV